MGPLVLKFQDQEEITIGLPTGIVSMDDVSISDEGYLFGLSVFTPVICSFNVNLGNIVPFGCIDAVEFSLEEYTGLSCNKGTCVVSGGKGGYTVVYYDRETGLLDSTLKCLNCRADVDDDASTPYNYVEVVVMNSRYAAFSVLENSGYHSIVVDLISNIADVVHMIPGPVNETLAVAPTNFPCVSDVYRSSGGQEYLFTACGSLTVQLVLTANTTTAMSPPVKEFTAVTLSVDSDLDLLVVGGRAAEGGVVALYTIDPDDPSNTRFESVAEVELTVLSVASHGGTVGFLALEVQEIVSTAFTLPPSTVEISTPPSVAPEANFYPSSIPSGGSSPLSSLSIPTSMPSRIPSGGSSARTSSSSPESVEGATPPPVSGVESTRVVHALLTSSFVAVLLL